MGDSQLDRWEGGGAMLVVRAGPIQFAIHSSPALGKYALITAVLCNTVGTVGTVGNNNNRVDTILYLRYRTAVGTPGVKYTRRPN